MATDGFQDVGPILTVNRDIQATIDTTNSLLGLYREIKSEVSSYRVWKKQVDRLLGDLGEWAPLILRKRGREHVWVLPVLSIERFEEHLRGHGGMLFPTENGSASVEWASLLSALGIGPSSDVIHWRSTQRTKFDPIATGAIRLQVDGPVLCHIVNLYRIYDFKSNRIVPRISSKTSFNLSFGRLDIRPDQDSPASFIAEFKEKSQEALRKKSDPFQYRHPLKGKWTVIEPGTAYTAYEVALHYGIYPARATLSTEDAHHTRPRRDRAEMLISSMKTIKESTTELFLVTEQWIDDATRIYRRIAADPDAETSIEDTRLAEHLAATASSPEYRNRFISPIIPDEEVDGIILNYMKQICMIGQGAKFRVSWTRGTHRSDTDKERARARLRGHLVSFLPDLLDAWQGEWNSELSQMAQDGSLAQLLRIPHDLVDQPILILGLSESHELWGAEECYIE